MSGNFNGCLDIEDRYKLEVRSLIGDSNSDFCFSFAIYSITIERCARILAFYKKEKLLPSNISNPHNMEILDRKIKEANNIILNNLQKRYIKLIKKRCAELLIYFNDEYNKMADIMLSKYRKAIELYQLAVISAINTNIILQFDVIAFDYNAFLKRYQNMQSENDSIRNERQFKYYDYMANMFPPLYAELVDEVSKKYFIYNIVEICLALNKNPI